ncbi:DUF6538 domain-containing protein [uncultured Reyranella sp.]|uniref:DUF6538 domain-containing protein n=1 Tax=uncultured Reyranella sp. TaxID=735512 RepID=UPI0034561D7A
MARPWRHPKTGKLYFRKAIPEHLRKAAGMREFKRSLNTSDAREGRKRHSAIAGEYDALIERLEAPPVPTLEAEQVQTIAVTPGDLHALAGDLWRWLLERYAASPAPDEAFSKTAPNGPWGAASEPWTAQRYALQWGRRLRTPPAEQGIVVKFVGEFLAEKRIGLGASDRSAFYEAARDAIDGALADLQRRFRGDLTDSPMLARYPDARPNARQGVGGQAMTVVAIWREGQVLWAAADTRISTAGKQGVIIRTDSAAKLLPLRVKCRQVPAMSGVLAHAHFDRTFGFAYAGDTLPALQVYAASVAFLDSLQANGYTDPPSLSQVAGLVRGLGERFGREVAESRHTTALDLTLAVFGYCPVQLKYAVYLIKPVPGEPTLRQPSSPLRAPQAYSSSSSPSQRPCLSILGSDVTPILSPGFQPGIFTPP